MSERVSLEGHALSREERLQFLPGEPLVASVISELGSPGARSRAQAPRLMACSPILTKRSSFGTRRSISGSDANASEPSTPIGSQDGVAVTINWVAFSGRIACMEEEALERT